MTFIYGLYAEGEELPRYIGKTTGKLKYRIAGHHNSIRFTKALYGIDLPDLNLQIRAIEEVEDSSWGDREIYWIKHFKDMGATLANASPGGGLWSAETLEKQRRRGVGKHERKRKSRPVVRRPCYDPCRDGEGALTQNERGIQ